MVMIGGMELFMLAFYHMKLHCDCGGVLLLHVFLSFLICLVAGETLKYSNVNMVDIPPNTTRSCFDVGP